MAMIKKILVTGLLIVGTATGITVMGNAILDLKEENNQRVFRRVEESNQPITLSFERGDMSYQPCEVHGSDLVINGTANDGRTQAVSIFDSPNCVRDGLYALLNAEEGNITISFPQGNLRPVYPMPNGVAAYALGSIPGETYFTSDKRFGAKRADRITVLED